MIQRCLCVLLVLLVLVLFVFVLLRMCGCLFIAACLISLRQIVPPISSPWATIVLRQKVLVARSLLWLPINDLVIQYPLAVHQMWFDNWKLVNLAVHLKSSRMLRLAQKRNVMVEDRVAVSWLSWCHDK